MLSSYFLELRTGENYTEPCYDEAAGSLMHMLANILSNAEHLSALTHNAPRESCHSEIEVMLEEGELVAKAVVDIHAQGPVKLDKSKFTKLVKARAEAEEWKNLKVHKRQVPNVPSPP